MATARRLFAERGYANVPANEIVAEAGLTRGALYHHYTDKTDLFRAVLVELESELDAEIRAAGENLPDADLATMMMVRLGTFLDACQRPEVVRIVLTDAPAVLGWTEWRAIEGEYGLGLITEAIEAAIAAGLLAPQPVRVLAQLVLSAIMEAAMLIAHAEDRDTARAQAQQALLALLGGLMAPAAGGGHRP